MSDFFSRSRYPVTLEWSYYSNRKYYFFRNALVVYLGEKTSIFARTPLTDLHLVYFVGYCICGASAPPYHDQFVEWIPLTNNLPRNRRPIASRAILDFIEVGNFFVLTPENLDLRTSLRHPRSGVFNTVDWRVSNFPVPGFSPPDDYYVRKIPCAAMNSARDKIAVQSNH